VEGWRKMEAAAAQDRAEDAEESSVDWIYLWIGLDWVG